MYCQVCFKKISSRRHVFNLFKRETHHICERCYLKYPLIPKRSIIPIQNGIVLWQSMIQTSDWVSPIAHMSFYKPYFIDYLKHYPEYIFLIEDLVEENFIKVLDLIRLGNIYLLTLYGKIKIKENDYEI